jgi:hypothetical protein
MIIILLLSCTVDTNLFVDIKMNDIVSDVLSV